MEGAARQTLLEAIKSAGRPIAVRVFYLDASADPMPVRCHHVPGKEVSQAVVVAAKRESAPAAAAPRGKAPGTSAAND